MIKLLTSTFYRCFEIKLIFMIFSVLVLRPSLNAQVLNVDRENGQDSICLFKNITGSDCYGCGMTRAILSALHFRLDNAFHYNKLFVIVLPLLVYIWTKTFIKAVYKQI